MEQYLRDCKIATLYEGTNYIQALDLVGRKMGANRGMNVMNLFGLIDADIKKAKENEEMKAYVTHLEDAYNAVVGIAMQFAAWGKSASVMLPVLNARPFLMILGDLAVGWQLFRRQLSLPENWTSCMPKLERRVPYQRSVLWPVKMVMPLSIRVNSHRQSTLRATFFRRLRAGANVLRWAIRPPSRCWRILSRCNVMRIN